LVRKGIPNPFRGIVWQLLCSVCDCPDKERYADYLKMTSPFEKTISRDITRTFPGHDLFKEKDGIGQESLFNVMKASMPEKMAFSINTSISYLPVTFQFIQFL